MLKKVIGYAGKQLRISLNDKSYKVEKIDIQVLRDYLGGAGYAARVLYDEIPKNTHPLLPENKLMFTTSPLTTNRIPGGGSIMLCFKSPLTNAWGESRCGGNFGPDLKKAGYDFLIIEGKSKKPVYLVINDDNIEFRSAIELMGKTVSKN